MRRGVSTILALTLILTLGGDVLALSEEELQEQIEAKQREIDELNKEINSTQGQVTQLQGQAKTLQSAIGQIDAGIKQATLGIRSSEVNIEKLTLEIESLGYEVEETSQEVRAKQEQVRQLLRTIQKKDEYGFLQSILGTDTLAEGIAEINAINTLQNNILGETIELTNLQNQYRETINVSSNKKSQLEVEVVNLESRKVILDEQKGQKAELLTETKSQEGEYQRLLSSLEEQQQALQDEIADIEAQLSKDFDRSTVPSREPGSFMWPVTANGQKVGVITQNYGETAYAYKLYKYYKGRPHNGMDIGAPMGTEVRAAANGKVARVDFNGQYYFYGRYVLIDHGNGLSTLYAHLSGTTVKTGDSVEQGDLIGYVGSTGYSTGPHLHWGLFATPAGGWVQTAVRELGGLLSVPPSIGLLPVGVTLNPAQYL